MWELKKTDAAGNDEDRDGGDGGSDEQQTKRPAPTVISRSLICLFQV
jgi:hypothetical protein